MSNEKETMHQTSGNPLLDALPPQLSLKEFYEAVSYVPSLPDNYKKMSMSERYALAENIANIYLPLDFSVVAYHAIYSGIRSAYKGKTQTDIIRQLNEVGKCIFYKHPEKMEDARTQAECFSILGEPGMGKTVTIQKILNLFPQVIHHEEYEGHPFEHEQIVYIKIESPANNSPRGACLQILAAIDEILGTDLCAEERRRSSNLDMLITRIAQICTRFSIGCIVIDEIQNILQAVTPNKSFVATTGSHMVKFLVELANKTGVCLAFVGIPTVIRMFDTEPHLARRTRGPRVPNLDNDETFETILQVMWDNMPILYPVPLSKEIKEKVYKITGGVIAKMQKLIILSAQHAIYFETEQVNEKLLTKIAKQYNIVPGQSMLQTSTPELLPQTITRTSTKQPKHTKEKGRPKQVREENDIMEIFDKCRTNGWSVAVALIQQNLAERGEPNGTLSTSTGLSR